MKTPVLVAIVVMLHVAVIGSLVVIQGCGSTREPSAPPAARPLPPPVMPARPLPPDTARPLPPTPPPRVTEVAPSAPVDTVEYVVQTGDSLSKIAARHKVPMHRITELNKISDPNKIMVGQKLIVPARPGVTVHQPAKPRTAAPVDGTEYVVQTGDTLSGIAVRFGTKVEALRTLNNLTGDKILVGQKLIVTGDKPGAKPAPTAKPVVAPSAKPAPAVETDVDEIDESPATAEPALPAAGLQEIIHVVMANEDLDYIARLYVVSVDDIVKLNNLSERKVQVGQRLQIP